MKEKKISNQYYYKFGDEVISTSSEFELNKKDYVNKCFASEDKVEFSLKGSNITVGGKIFKILTLSPDTKDPLHHTEKEMSRKTNAVKYDSKGNELNFDYILGVYDSGDEYLSVVIPAEIIRGQTKIYREAIFRTHLDYIINCFLSSGPITIPFRRNKIEPSVSEYNFLSFRGAEISQYLIGEITEQSIRKKSVVVSDKSTWMKPKEIFSKPIIRNDSKEQIGALGEFIFKTIYEMENDGVELEWNYLKGDKYAKWDLSDEKNNKFFEVKTTTIGSVWHNLSIREREFFEENINDYSFAFVTIDQSVYKKLISSMKEDDDWEISKSEIINLNKQNDIEISLITGKEAKEKLEFVESGWLIKEI